MGACSEFLWRDEKALRAGGKPLGHRVTVTFCNSGLVGVFCIDA